MLIACFFTLTSSAQHSIRRALGGASTKKNSLTRNEQTSSDLPLPGPTADTDANESASNSLQEVDLLLPKICEALVLTTQCLTSLTLQSEDDGKKIHRAQSVREEASTMTDVIDGAESLKTYVGNASSSTGEELIEALIGEH